MSRHLHRFPTTTEGMTLVEAVLAMSCIAITSAAMIAAFIYLQRSALDDSYRTGCQRVLQSHVERLMAMPANQITNQGPILTYNYSGLRVTSVSDIEQQQSLTNLITKRFSTPLGSTNATEDAVLAYGTEIVVTNYWVTNTFRIGGTNNTQIIKAFRRANIITTYFDTSGRAVTNSTIVIRAEN